MKEFKSGLRDITHPGILILKIQALKTEFTINIYLVLDLEIYAEMWQETRGFYPKDIRLQYLGINGYSTGFRSELLVFGVYGITYLLAF